MCIHKTSEYDDISSADLNLHRYTDASSEHINDRALFSVRRHTIQIQEHFKNVRHCGFVEMYWSLAFVVKLITASFQSVNFDFATNFNTEVKDKQTDYDSKSIF